MLNLVRRHNNVPRPRRHIQGEYSKKSTSKCNLLHYNCGRGVAIFVTLILMRSDSRSQIQTLAHEPYILPENENLIQCIVNAAQHRYCKDIPQRQ